MFALPNHSHTQMAGTLIIWFVHFIVANVGRVDQTTGQRYQLSPIQQAKHERAPDPLCSGDERGMLDRQR
eukprot:scaffold652_cov38-Prasinocladus_malaysianus.AAC.2